MARKKLSRSEICVKFFELRPNKKFTYQELAFHLSFNETPEFFRCRIERLIRQNKIKKWRQGDTIYYSHLNYSEED